MSGGPVLPYAAISSAGALAPLTANQQLAESPTIRVALRPAAERNMWEHHLGSIAQNNQRLLHFLQAGMGKFEEP